MEKYEVVSVIGEGSFGRVYKAKVLDSNTFVALKLIVKKGRTSKDITGLNQECEILRKLNHPNIIPMLDSFETDNEIVIITEFVDRELYEILGREGYLQEDQVQKITCDLVSALFYLHSNRVLHRDLKPQNILLDGQGNAKLCDFGLARCMGNSTHVLTSFKGTPLYMAPELLDQTPYDHTADLWSLGCIVYELLVGSPPFSTTSILQLVQLIQHETVQWPDFISPDCKDFLQGLLQKQPEKRFSWQQILDHPFLKNGVLTVESKVNNPFTTALTASQCLAKETQTFAFLSRNESWKRRTVPVRRPEEPFRMPKTKTSSCPSQSNLNKSVADVPQEMKTLHSSWVGTEQIVEATAPMFSSLERDLAKLNVGKEKTEEEANKDGEAASSIDKSESVSKIKKSGQLFTLHSWDSAASARPIENDEWLAFLQRNMEEIMSGQLECVRNHNLVSVVVAPLRNSNASSRVLEYVASMLSLPFVIDGPSQKDLELIKQVYLEMKVIPNLVYASKIVARRRGYDSSASSPSVLPGSELLLRPVSQLSAEELQALQTIYLLVCHLVHSGEDFLVQFCDAAAILNTVALMQQFLLLGRRKVRIVTDLLAILNLTLRELPENSDIVQQIVLGSAASGTGAVDVSKLLTHPSGVVRSRSCELIKHLSEHGGEALQSAYGPRLEHHLQALLEDKVPSARIAAEEAYKRVKHLYEGKTG